MAEAIPTTKTCRVCNTEKGRELFPKQGRVCKACISKRTLTRYTPEQQATSTSTTSSRRRSST